MSHILEVTIDNGLNLKSPLKRNYHEWRKATHTLITEPIKY